MRKKPVMAECYRNILFIGLLFFVGVHCEEEVKETKLNNVTYDARSLIIHGQRALLYSGSVHYPRVPVEVYMFKVIHEQI